MSEPASKTRSSLRRLAVASLPVFLSIPSFATAQLDLDDVVAIAHRAGFACTGPLLAAVAIAVAESSLYPGIGNPHPEYGARDDGDHHEDRGVWQISSFWWPEYSDAEVMNPHRGAEIAFVISKEGSDFTPWDSFRNGNAQLHYDLAFDGWPPLRPVVQAFCQELRQADEVPLPRPRP
jgi:hypothetical protein